MHSSPSCPVVFSDVIASLRATGRCDDGSDDSIASSSVAHQAVLKGIGRLEAIEPITIQVALSSSNIAEAFKFSRVWKIPRLVMELSSGRLALTNISFFLSDDVLASEDILIGLPVLQHLGIDSRTLLERNRATLDGTDCSSVPHPSVSKTCGSLGGLMIARHQRVVGREPIDHNFSRSPRVPRPDPVRPRANYFAYRFDEDPFPDPDMLELDDKSTEEAERKNIKAMIQRAVDNNIDRHLVKPLHDLVWEFRSTFSTSFSRTPSKVDPLRIELTPDARPTRVKLRNYSPSQRIFMKKMMDELISHDIMYPNPSSPWASAPHIVPKPGPAEWRFTVDLSPVNRYTVPFQFPMPVIVHELAKTAKSKNFAGVDFIHSYWQLLLAAESRVSQSVITPDGIFTPTRVLHGTTNAVLHLQAFLSTKLPSKVLDCVLLWVDDCLFHEETTEALLHKLCLFFKFCVEWNWKLNPCKCNLYMTEARWCGRITSVAGIRHDPSRLEGLTSMECPTTGAQLQMFLCAMQWLRSAIPNFQVLTADLHDLLRRVYAHAGKRTKRAVARVSLRSIGWNHEHTNAFESCKQSILHRTTLAHRDEAKRLCIYTDASDTHWAGIVTQVPYDQQSRPHAKQEHEPLAFHSGRFSKTQIEWSTLEKEAFVVMASIEPSHWLASCADGFDLFTDHNNLIFIFDPLAVMPDIGQATIRKVLRWAVRLSLYNYVCIHIRGEDNVWADLMTRWTTPTTIRRLVTIPMLPSTFTDFEWPTVSSIRAAQDKYAAHRPTSARSSEGLWRFPTGSVWIPDMDEELQLRLCVIAHTGSAGHRSAMTTKLAISREFYWATFSGDVDLFVWSCIHCLSTKGGGKMPRPYGPALFGTKTNKLVQFDYIELGPSLTGEKYVFMVRDDHSGYNWFYPAPSTNSKTAANALLDWIAAFGAPLGLMSDGPTHFKNETLRLLSKGLSSPHHFTLPYCPWSNGAVERLGKELLCVARALLSELQMHHDNWLQLVPLFQSAVNNAPSPQRNNVAPITAFTGRPALTPVSTFLRSSDCQPISLREAQLESALNLSELIKYMDKLHPLIHQNTQKERGLICQVRSQGKLANFCEGDYVLVSRDAFSEGEKPCFRWRRPRRVIKVLSDHTFRVEDLRTGNYDDIHGTRLKFYRDVDLDVTEIMSHVLSSETGMLVARLLRLVDQEGDLFVVVCWKGLSSSEDTIEALARVYEDVPKLTQQLLNRKSTPSALRIRAHAALGL